MTTLQTRNGWLIPTSAGMFELDHLRPLRELAMLHEWMGDPDVDRFWALAGREDLDRHIAAQLDSAHSTPYIGRLDGEPMSYWEVSRADLDPPAAHYPARSHDAGLHLLIGPAALRGRGFGSVLIRAVTEWVLARHPQATRVVAEPDLRDERSVRAFAGAGYDRRGELDLPDKQAALMVCDRSLVPIPGSRRAA
jgi:RimJ/RimL family protein N-acetyltransferase